ncbi:pilus assembly protein PilP [Pseudomonas sp. ABC1]|uniref:pilus assembly protein PilP n=1 Tax=Pseudomonas sp. ABC1 TaxID=2748080 RepID=UPI0015C33464|nr:pilus assembly protein PilP [Pseudomonas sp. ABC1]QLF92895.1 pilus assembly protein PilP [Pseudomonas sp. ABC1]
MKRVCLLTILLLAGCDEHAAKGDLSGFVAETLARPALPPEPLPVFSAYEGFTYTAAALRHPFQAIQGDGQGDSLDFPGNGQPRGLLEGADIARFTMVGWLSGRTGRYGLAKGEGGVHRVGVGDYLGTSRGRVVAIEEASIELLEVVPDGEGGWHERPRRLVLAVRP